jgi:hypothetical protein
MNDRLLQAVAGGISRACRAAGRGRDCDARDADGATALMLAAHASHLDVVRALIDAGADVNATDRSGWGPLMKAVYRKSRPRLCGCRGALIQAGAAVRRALPAFVR